MSEREQQHDRDDDDDDDDEHDDGDVDLPFEMTVGVISMIQQDWWFEHPDVLSEAEQILGWEELHVDRRTVGPVIEERPAQRVTMSVEEAAVILGISRALAYVAVDRGEIPSIRIGRRIVVPVAGLNRLLETAGADGD
jgi:excisionase family DNA binding protein